MLVLGDRTELIKTVSLFSPFQTKMQVVIPGPLMNEPAFAWTGKVQLPSEDWDPGGAPVVPNKTGRVGMISQAFPTMWGSACCGSVLWPLKCKDPVKI